MWTRCMFCSHDLGRNEAVESFPVGRRFAFDGAKGRLWVVCRGCEGWNLTPLEERWEAIEESEKLFRGTHTRVSTGELGLARVPEGLELVRIGRPLRPEFAAWRYGDQFGRRRRRAMVMGPVVVGLGAATVVGHAVLGPAGLIFASAYHMWLAERRTSRIRRADGRLLEVPGSQLQHVFWALDDSASGERPGWQLSVPHTGGREVFKGQEAVAATSRLLRRINRAGATRRTVQVAVDRIEHHGDPDRFLAKLIRERAAEPGPAEFALPDWSRVLKDGWPSHGKVVKGSLARMGVDERLALEMALHEEQERRAMREGELHLLESAWREAEEIAAIADDLLTPSRVTEWIERYRGA